MDTPVPADRSTAVHIEKGVCTLFFAFDLGFAIDLNHAQQLLEARGAQPTQRGTLRLERPSPAWFAYSPAPLRFTRPIQQPRSAAGYPVSPSLRAVLYDFGALSLAYSIPITGDVAALVQLGTALYEQRDLRDDACQEASRILAQIAPAVTKPGLIDIDEDYIVYHASRLSPSSGQTLEARLDADRQAIASLLRAEPRALSSQEVADALASPISYAPTDAAIIDWNAAFVVGDEMDDVLTILEFANVELLEMRYLDNQLDHALEQAFAVASRPSRFFSTRQQSADLREIARLQADASLLFEQVNNALKLVGDQHLSRLYRAALARFHLPDWDASILRKLHTLDSLYGKTSDRAANRRIEVLEWIIIILIAFEVVAGWLWPALRAMLNY
jgi:hypothetical protein